MTHLKESAGRRREFLPRESTILCAVALFVLAINLNAAAPYGDPNQPYDRLPGTLETYHVKWATPLPDGTLKILFIIPYDNSREVVELRQRLDLDYTVIMTGDRISWWEGYRQYEEASPIADGERVVNMIAEERLDPKREYDAIIIAKVCWDAIPKHYRDLILEHVSRGTGLIYVSPHRFIHGPLSPVTQMWEKPFAVTAEDNDYQAFFQKDSKPEITGQLTSSLPMELIPFKAVGSLEEFKKLPPSPKAPKGNIPVQCAINIRFSNHGKGKVIVLDYFDGPERGSNSLTPRVLYDPVMYDYAYALLARCVMSACDRAPKVNASISINAPAATTAATAEKKPLPEGWEAKSPVVVINRDELPKTEVILTAGSQGTAVQAVKFDLQIRDAKGKVLKTETIDASVSPEKSAQMEIRLPILERGNYFVDLRVLDAKGAVLDFASRSLRVETAHYVKKIETGKGYYEKDEKINGKAFFSRGLAENQQAEAQAIDTWGRVVFKTPVTLDADRTSGAFEMPVADPLCRLWDIVAIITDKAGALDRKSTWVGLPDWSFDEYLMALIFSAGPTGGEWKGYLYTSQVRKYGLNASNVYLIYGQTEQYEDTERAHLASISYTEHLGQYGPARALGSKYEEEFSQACMAEFGRMARSVADTGKPLDLKEFPYKWGQHSLGADFINSRIQAYKESIKFGSPYYFLTGEEYLSGEFHGRENSCFCPLCTRNFQEWCKEQYKNDLNALNAEWGSDFKSWDEIRGILIKEAGEKNQLPRWVAFRYFMRSKVWCQFFIDWTEMMRTILGRDIRTGTNGHEQYDFSRFRNHMTSGKIYACGQQVNGEYLECVGEELRQSFSGDHSFLLAPQSMTTFNHDFQTPLNNHRWPWKVLFAGLRGFDWEAGSASSGSLGGMSCMTPDFSEPLPFLKNISDEVLYLQRGIGKLCNTSKPVRAPVAILWSPINHYLSRLLPLQEQGFTDGWWDEALHWFRKEPYKPAPLFNIMVDGGAIGDALVMMKNLRMRPTFVAPEDLKDNGLAKRGFTALILPYNKGMSEGEANAIRSFVENGGLVIADNDPGSYSRFGKKLEKELLSDLFPETDRDSIVRVGKGVAAYLPNGINGYVARMEKCDYAGSDSVALLLKEYAGIESGIELIDGKGNPRRDTLMPIYLKGSAKFFGLLRASTSEGKEVEETTVKLDQLYHAWDVRESKYLGSVDTFKINLDLYPKFFALLPANPTGLKLTTAKAALQAGEVLKIAGEVAFESGTPDEIAKLGQVVHIEVFGPDGKELEWYRSNLLFDGRNFEIPLPLSYSEKPGEYAVKVEYPITGMKAATKFEVQ